MTVFAALAYVQNAVGPHVVTNCDETIVSSFPIHLQFALKLSPEVDWLNLVSIRIGSMRILCVRDQFELICIQCALFLSRRQAFST